MLRDRARRLVLSLLALAVLVPLAYARFEWRDVVQDVRILADGTVEVRDERTLWTDQDFGEAFVCVELSDHQRLSLLEGETTALSPGPAAVGVAQPCDGGMEVVVRQEARVQKRRVRFAYRIEGSLDVYSDVVQWYWNILERDRPVVLAYHLTVRAPGAMGEPFDAFVMRYANPEVPRVVLSDDRDLLSVEFDRVPTGDGVEIRYLMDPQLFGLTGDEPGLESLLRDQARISLD
jgi:hypothetical protein